MNEERARDRVSCSTYAYSRWELADALASIARVGYRGVEILTQPLRRPDGHGGQQPHAHLRPDWPDGRIAAVQEQLGRLRLQPVCLSPSTDFLQPHYGSVQAEIDEVCRTVDLAVRLGAPLVRPFATDAVPEGMDRAAAIGAIGEALRACGRYAEARGARIAVENHGVFPGVAQNMADILRAAGSPAVGLCLHIPRDTAEQLVDLVPDKIWHMHLSDQRPAIWRDVQHLRRQGLSDTEIAARLDVRPTDLPPEGIALGEGGADLPAIVAAIRRTGYAGWWNHEGSPEADPEPTEQRSFAYLTSLLAA